MEHLFTRFANSVSRAAGRPLTFVICCGSIVLWAATGPLFGLSDTWQLAVNTSTTIITFLMVFLLQNTGNRTIEELQDRLREVEALNREVLAELRALRAESKHRPVLREVA